MLQSFSPQDHQFMALAIKLAKKGHYTTSPNPRVGCVIVKEGQIVGKGFHEKAGLGHAEVNALNEAGENAQGATAYVTLEPCSHYGRTPPCARGLIEAGITKVIAAMVDPNPEVSGRGLSLLEAAGIETKCGLLEEEAKQANTGFIHLMNTDMPYVRCKLAASLDGKTAMASGESKWITSAEARRDVQRLRAQSCAVITGADAILVDNAKMTVRYEELGYAQSNVNKQDLRQPLRVVIDSKNRLIPTLTFFETQTPVLLIRETLENNHQWPHFVTQVVLPKANNSAYIDLACVLKYLAKQGINDVLIESGKTLAGAFISQNLVNELIIYQAPKLLGENSLGLLAMPSINKLAQAKKIAFSHVSLIGPDIKIIAKFQ